ncbi:MAG TPA: histidine phosphatase family protein [Chthoniobacterales bacterium]
MTNFVFIRHGAHDYLGRAIAGRLPGVHLNERGREQAEHLPEKLSRLPIDAICSGPLERVRETAEPICRHFNLPLQIADEFTEIGVGDWQDRAFTELTNEPLWKQFNAFRSSTAAVGGELMLEVQARALRKLNALRGQHRWVVVVTHGDVVRSVMAHFLGMHLDLFLRIEIDPASLSILEYGEDFAIVRLLNMPSSGSPLELPAARHQ